jgi:peptidoglycan/LPS O-acetylase OafA/YrhL
MPNVGKSRTSQCKPNRTFGCVKNNMSHRPTTTYHALNATRGFAAVIVLVGHASPYFGFDIKESYLAVDVFFLLSGFVLAHAYQARLEQGLGAGAFMKLRFIRLAPLFYLGVTISLVGIGVATLMHARISWTFLQLVVNVTFNALLLPAPPLHGPSLFPLNAPGWSLFFELVVNVLFASWLWRWSNVKLFALVLSMSVALAMSALYEGSLSGGWGWPTLAVGFFRVMFAFPLGMLMFRVTRSWRRLDLPPILVSIAVVAPLIGVYGIRRDVYDALVVIFVIPTLVLVAALVRAPRDTRLFTWLGDVSYAVYAIHWSPLYIVTMCIPLVFHGDRAALAPWLGCCYLLLMLCAAYYLDRCFDAPVRRYLARHSSSSRVPPTRDDAMFIAGSPALDREKGWSETRNASQCQAVDSVQLHNPSAEVSDRSPSIGP